MVFFAPCSLQAEGTFSFTVLSPTATETDAAFN